MRKLPLFLFLILILSLNIPISLARPDTLTLRPNADGQYSLQTEWQATDVFSDQFECGDFSAWSLTSGTPIVQSTIKHHGTYALSADGQNDYAQYTYGSAVTEVYARIYFYIDAGTWDAAADRFGIFWIVGTGTAIYVGRIAGVYVSQTGRYLELRYLSGVSSITDTSSTVINLDTWYCLEIHVVVSGTVGAVQVYLNGTEVTDITQSGLDNDANGNISKVQVGQRDTSGITDGINIVDCAIISDTRIDADGNPFEHFERTSDQSDSTGVKVTCYTGEDVVYSNLKEALNLQDHTTETETINSVTAYMKTKASGGGNEQAVILWRTYSTDYESDAITVSTSAFTEYSQQRTTNPNTGVAWTWAEVDSLQIGSRATALDAAESIAVSEYWIVVDYSISGVTQNFYGSITQQFTIDSKRNYQFNRFTSINPTFNLITEFQWQISGQYYGNRYLAEDNPTWQIYGSRKLSYKFNTLSNTGTIDKIAVFCRAVTGTSPEYSLELQSDDGSANHYPSGTVLTAGTFTPASVIWYEVDVTNYTVSSNTIYHVVLNSTAANSTNSAYFGSSQPKNELWVNDIDMPDRDVVYNSGASWANQNDEPVWWLRWTDTTRFGNVFGKYEFKLYPTSPSYTKIGERFTVTGGDKQVTKVGMRFKKIGTPPNDVIMHLFNITGNAMIEEGTIASTGALTTSFQWFNYTFSSPITLKNGIQYRLYVDDEGGDANNCPIVSNDADFGLAGAQGPLTYDGTNSNWAHYSGSWSSSNDTDLIFLFTLVSEAIQNFFGSITQQFSVAIQRAWQFSRFCSINPVFTISLQKQLSFNIFSSINPTFNILSSIETISTQIINIFGDITQLWTTASQRTWAFNLYPTINPTFSLTSTIEFITKIIDIWGSIQPRWGITGWTTLPVAPIEISTSTAGFAIIALVIALSAFALAKKNKSMKTE